MGFGNPADSIDQKIGQKMAELRNRRKDKINQIKKTPGAGEPFGSELYEIKGRDWTDVKKYLEDQADEKKVKSVGINSLEEKISSLDGAEEIYNDFEKDYGEKAEEKNGGKDKISETAKVKEKEKAIENFSEYELELIKIYKEHVENMFNYIRKLDYIGKFGFEKGDVESVIETQIKRFQSNFDQHIIDKNEFSSREKAEKAFRLINDELNSPLIVKEITEEKDDSERAMAWHTLYKLGKSPDFLYSDLDISVSEEEENPDTLELKKKRNQKFLDLTKKLWGEFAVHGGDPRINDKGETYIPCESDLDGESYLKILELAGFTIDRGKVNFVKKGEMPEEGVIGDTSKRNGVIAEEKGKRIIFDHHTPEAERDTSATKYAYEALVKFGLLEKKPEIEKFVEFVTKIDSFYFSPDEEKKVYENYSKNLYGLCYRMKPQDILELFKENSFDPSEKLKDEYLKKYKYFNPAMKKEETLFQLSQHIEKKIKSGESEIKNLEKLGFFVDTGDNRFGKILIDTKKTNGNGNWYPKVDSENHSSQLAIRLRGYGGYLLWSQGENSFILYTNKRMDENLVPGGFPQGENMRGHILVKGFNDSEPLRMSMEDIFSRLAGKKFEFDKELKEKLDTESKAKEMVRLIAQEKLTEDVLKQAAKDSNISLKRLLDETINQLNKVKKVFQDKLKKLPKDKNTVAKRNIVAIKILLEYQKKKNGNNSQFPSKPAGTPLQQPKTPDLTVQPDKKQEDISNSVKKLAGLFSNFNLSYDALKEEANNINVSPAELAVGFIEGNDELSSLYEVRKGSINEQDEKEVEKLAMTIILENEQKRVEEKIKNERENDHLRITLRKIKADLIEIRRIVN